MTELTKINNPVDAKRQAGDAVKLLTAAQKAAVIISILGEEAAKPLMEDFENDLMLQIAQAYETISLIPRAQIIEIIMEFLTRLRETTGALRGGKIQAQQLIGSLLNQERMNAIFGNEEEAEEVVRVETDTWERLSQRPSKKIAEYLCNLPENIVSLVLSQLNPDKIASILGLLDDEKTQAIINHFVENIPVNPAVYGVIGKMVEIEFLNRKSETNGQPDAHLDAIGEILSLIPKNKQANLLSFLENAFEEKASQIRNAMFTMESLPEILPRNAVSVVFREIPMPDLLRLMRVTQSGQPATAEFLFNNISKRIAEQIKEDMAEIEEAVGDVAEQIQTDFLMKVIAMVKAGQIQLEKRPTTQADAA